MSPTNGAAYPREMVNSTYYDPTTDYGDANASWSNPNAHYARPSPLLTQPSRDPFHYPQTNLPDQTSYHPLQHSPAASHFPQISPTYPPSSHSHPPSRLGSISQSPARSTFSSHLDYSKSMAQQNIKSGDPNIPPSVSARYADPMAFSSILSNPTVDTTFNSHPSPELQIQTPIKPRKSSLTSIDRHLTLDSFSQQKTQKALKRVAPSPTTTPSKRRVSVAKAKSHVAPATPLMAEKTASKASYGKESELRAMEVDTKMEEDTLSDLDSADFLSEKIKFKERSKKRQVEIDEGETNKRKKRRTTMITKLSTEIALCAESAQKRFRQDHDDEASTEVRNREVQDEKERKKDMQRKRRREKTVQNEYQKQKDAMEKAKKAADKAEQAKFMKEAQRAEKKAQHTKAILRGDGAKELREVTPLAPNLEGGTMNTFSMTKDPIPEQPKKKGRGGARPRKSKEKKKAEKDAAEAAYAAMESNELVLIAPKEDKKETPKSTSKREPKEREAKDASPAPPVPYVSKGYNQIYDQIWRDIAKKETIKVFRIKEASWANKQANRRKTAQLASKESRRWQLRTNKSTKEIQARAKRGMKEMMTFWKRNEKQERDMRKLAEKQELENAKKAEADREASRQKRKLNFLISQTELYSHFIGRKIKTDEVERSTDRKDVAPDAVIPPVKPSALEGTDVEVEPGASVTNFEDLDFDNEDETVLKKAAMANAQNAVQEAQDRARAFNQPAVDDEGEMNFQNPTSLGDIDIEQPKLLHAQLKEYQLKGLNWLVNLYEQGINGILADEMGLGKTIQSISVMAYLAESHNIWGPFLVIAPASTLHNWQQEISRFVPDLKVLPYWGNAKDRKVLRKFWDRKHITYTKDAPFHVLVTSYQLVVQDTQYFQKIRWQYMILDEAQAIKSSTSSRWKSLLGFHCRNRLLLTGTPIQNNMQELWALLHFIMPSLFDNHDEFSEWFAKDIESHAQSNTKLNEDQLKRLHMILKPFMLRRIKKHVQKELGDKIEEDVYCDLTYRQRAYYTNLRNRISIMDLIEKAAIGDDQDTATLMNLVMQFRKVCNHPDLFERAETTSPFSFAHFAETASFMREGNSINVAYSTRNHIEFTIPRLVFRQGGRLDVPGRENAIAGFKGRYLDHMMNIWEPDYIRESEKHGNAFSWLQFINASAGEVSTAFHTGIFERAVALSKTPNHLQGNKVIYDDKRIPGYSAPTNSLFQIRDYNDQTSVSDITKEGYMRGLLDVSRTVFKDSGLDTLEQASRPAVSAPPIEFFCSSGATEHEKQKTFFNVPMRKALFGISQAEEGKLLEAKVHPNNFPAFGMLPAPISDHTRFTNIRVPSMRRFVTDSGKLAKLDQLLHQLKEGGHRVLLYFQMTRMIDLMEEYLTYCNYKYLRLDGSTKLEDRRDTVHDFQTRPEIFIFLLSTRAGGLGINLTSADTVIFYDSDWNPTIDSQAMDRAHRLGQTRQVTVYRMITRGTIEERIRKRALQKEEVQRVVISGGSGGGVDFNTRSRENRTKDIALWLADDDQAAAIERKEAEIAAAEAKDGPSKKKAPKKRKADISMDDMYHEGEGHFDDCSKQPSGAATPASMGEAPGRGKRGACAAAAKKGPSKRAKTTKERLKMIDGDTDM
ncbi:MAG: putative DNA helicase ino80 [Trizodia sp. TS-e1964]|nr:MAG: putative DNA helicase ino80 [Trizodia sp. TS-e1964]